MFMRRPIRYFREVHRQTRFNGCELCCAVIRRSRAGYRKLLKPMATVYWKTELLLNSSLRFGTYR